MRVCIGVRLFKETNNSGLRCNSKKGLDGKKHAQRIEIAYTSSQGITLNRKS